MKANKQKCANNLKGVAIGMILWGGVAFSIFIAAFAAAMAWEWVRMSDRDAPPRAFAIATGTAVGGTVFILVSGSLATRFKAMQPELAAVQDSFRVLAVGGRRTVNG